MKKINLNIFLKQTGILCFGLVAILCFNSTSALAQAPENTWTPNGTVYAIAEDANYTYMGGSFSHIGPYTGYGVKLTTTAVERDTRYPTVNGIVYRVLADGSGGWFICGEFTKVGTFTRNRIAHILSDGSVDTSWNPDANSTVISMIIQGSDMYVGGLFTSIGGQSRAYIAKLNITSGAADPSWNPGANNSIWSTAISGNDLYVGGGFQTIGGQSRNYLAKLDLSTGIVDANWNPNANSMVRTVATSGSDIYVGGNFSTVGGQTRNYIAKLDNSTGTADANWIPNADNYVWNITPNGADVYVSGAFTIIGGMTRNRIAKVNNANGTADVNFDPNANGIVRHFIIVGSNIYVTGDFTTMGGLARNRIARVNATTGAVDAGWDPDASQYCWGIAINGSDIYVGGNFTSIGGMTRNNIARINKSTGQPDVNWNPDAGGMVYSLAISGSDIYAGGVFTTMGGLTRNRLAKINNTTGAVDVNWDPNASASVNTVAVSGSDIYVGGGFITVGGLSRNKIAKLNNTTGNADATWNPNASTTVQCIAISGSDIYTGGDFVTIGGLSRSRLAKLNNTTGAADVSWNPNTNGTVQVIAIDGSDIYVGGNFTSVGGQTRNRIAKVNNTTGALDASWNPNAGSTVYSIVPSGSDIYTGGNFISIGGQSRNRIAKLNNTSGAADASWNPNSGGSVRSISVSGSAIFIGGQFTTIGGEPQLYFSWFPANLNTWTGAVSNDYNTPGNWSANAVPGPTDYVIIPSGTTNAPNLNDLSFTVGDFNQKGGQTLSLGSGNMNVTGRFLNNGSVGGTGKVILTGSSEQTISGSGTVANLEINNAGGAVIDAANGKLNVTGLLTLTSGTLTTNDNLVLRSSSPTVSAMVGPVTGSISGSVVHERYLSAPANTSGGRGWRLLCSPLKGSINNSVYDNWQNGGTIDGTGIEIWGPGGGNGLANGPKTSLRIFDQPTNTYTGVTNTQTLPLFDANGNKPFLVFVKGHYGVGNIGGPGSPTNADATGSLINGTQTYNFTPADPAKLYQLIGNPYACPIDFDKVWNNAGTANLQRKFWALDPSLNYIGAFVTVAWNGVDGYSVSPSSSQNQFIQTGQAFFVAGNNPGNQSTVVIEENDKETSASQTAVFRTNGGSLETFSINLNKDTGSAYMLADGVLINGHHNLTNTIGEGDAVKFPNFNETLSVLNGSARLAIEGRQLLDNGDTMKVGMSNMQQSNYQLELLPGNINAPWLNATLHDHFLNTATLVSLTSNTIYNFSVTSDLASTGDNRFSISFSGTSPLALNFVSVKAEKKEEGVQIRWSVADEEETTYYQVERSSDGKTFISIGSVEAGNAEGYQYMDSNPLNRDNYYRIKAVVRSNSGVYSKMVRVNVKSTTSVLSTYPNPVAGNEVTITLNGVEEGDYLVHLTSMNGQTMIGQKFNVERTSSVIKLDIGRLSSGVYILTVKDENGHNIATQELIRK